MKLILKVFVVLVFGLAVVCAGTLMAFTESSKTRFTRRQFSIHEEVIQADVGLGKRIYSIRSGCIDCHGTDLAGAKLMDDPAIGSIHGVNITPYKLKSWTDEEIAGAIRYGVHKEGRSLRFMPSFDYRGLSKADIASLIAYLRSVPEVKGESPPNSYGMIARFLSVIGKMPVMFPAFTIDQSVGFSEKPEEEPSLKFGKYLAGACIGCHGENFAGGKILGGDPSWGPSADIRLGRDSFWTEIKFREVILSGISPKTGKTLRQPMPIAALKQMSETEIKALWLFFSSLKD